MFSSYPMARKSTAFVVSVVMVFGSFLASVKVALAAPTTTTISTVAEFQMGTSIGTSVISGSGDGEVRNTSTENVDQSQTTGTATRAFDNVNRVAQTFTAAQNGLLSKVVLSLRRAVANTNGDITVEIRDTAAGLPTSVLASTSVPATTITNTQADVDFVFATPATVVSGTQYAIVIYRSGSGTLTADYLWHREASNPIDYAGGQAFRSTDSGATWPAVAQDMRFSQFFTVTTISGTQTSQVIDAGSQANFKELSWNENLPSGTDIQFEVRASDSLFLASNASLSWSSFSLANSPVTLSVDGRYIQWRATLTGTATATPALTDVSITFNEAPVLDPIGDQTVNEGDTLTFTANATDANTDALTYSLVGAPTTADIDANTGVFTWTPTESDGPNDYTFDVVVSDGNGGSDSETITVTVAEVQTPAMANDSSEITAEDTPVSVTLGMTDPDDPVSTLTYSIVSAPSNGSLNAITGNQVTYTPNLNFNGSDEFSFQIADFEAGSISNVATVSLTITPVNDAPVANPVAVITNEDIPLTITLSSSDVDGAAPVYDIVTGPTNGSLGTVSGNQVTYTPNLNYNGVDSFTYRVSDGVVFSNTATVDIVVNSLNDGPILNLIGNQIVDEQTSLTFTASAVDPEVPASQSFTFSLVGAIPSGADIDANTGVFTWTPTEAQGPASYSFVVMVSDNSSVPGFDSTPVVITVNEVNIAPVVPNIVGVTSTNPATPVTITLSNTDPDFPANIITYSIVSAPASGSAVIVGNQVTYTPTAVNWGGLDSFTYQAFDGTAYSTPGTVDVMVTTPAQAIPAAGAYTWVQYVALSRPNSTAIYYTIDGSMPNCSGPVGTLYTAPIRVSRTKDIKSIACYPNGFVSPVKTDHYDIDIHATAAQIPQLFVDQVFVTTGPTSAATELTSTERVTIDADTNGGTSSIIIPQDTIFMDMNGAPFNANALTIANTGNATYGGLYNVTYDGVVMWGSTDPLVVVANTLLDAKIWIGSASNGETRGFRHSSSGNVWDTTGLNTNTGICSINGGFCSFQTLRTGYLAVFHENVTEGGSPVPTSNPAPSGGTGGGSSGGSSNPTPAPAPTTSVAPVPTTSTQPVPTTSTQPSPEGTVAGSSTTGGNIGDSGASTTIASNTGSGTSSTGSNSTGRGSTTNTGSTTGNNGGIAVTSNTPKPNVANGTKKTLTASITDTLKSKNVARGITVAIVLAAVLATIFFLRRKKI